MYSEYEGCVNEEFMFVIIHTIINVSYVVWSFVEVALFCKAVFLFTGRK